MNDSGVSGSVPQDPISGTDLITPIAIDDGAVWAILPQITVNNPKWWNANLYSGDPINLRFAVNVAPGTREVTVNLSGKTIYTATNGTLFMVPINTEWLSPGKYPITISLIDSNLKSAEKSITITILER
jgi:hypothetical protein